MTDKTKHSDSAEPVAAKSPQKWRNKKTGTVYAMVSFNYTPIAVVTTEAGSSYTVNRDSLERVTDMATTDPDTTKDSLESAPPTQKGER